MRLAPYTHEDYAYDASRLPNREEKTTVLVSLPRVSIVSKHLCCFTVVHKVVFALVYFRITPLMNCRFVGKLVCFHDPEKYHCWKLADLITPGSSEVRNQAYG